MRPSTLADYVLDSQVLEEVTIALGRCVEEVNFDKSFVSNGGDSLRATILKSALASQGYHITRESILKCRCLGDLLNNLQFKSLVSSGVSPTTDRPSRGQRTDSPATSLTSMSSPQSETTFSDCPSGRSLPDALHLPVEKDLALSPLVQTCSIAQSEADVLTEMQLSLIHESLTHCGSNLITYTERHPSESIPVLLTAWRKAIELEDIFRGSWFSELVSMRTASSTVPAQWSGFSLDATVCESGSKDSSTSTITWVVHHAFIDAYSFNRLLSKVQALAVGQTPTPGPSFWDWARDLRRYQSINKATGDAFWRKSIAKHKEARSELLLPRPSRAVSAHETEDASVDTLHVKTEATLLEATALSANITPAALYYAAWVLLLAVFTDSDSICFGAVMSGRGIDVPGSLEAIGPLINVIPFYFTLRRTDNVRYLLEQVFHSLVELEAFSWTTTDNGFVRQYDSALSVQIQEPGEMSCHRFKPLETSIAQHSLIPISVTVNQQNVATIDFHSDRFSRRDSALIVECYEQALSSLTNLETTVGNIMQALLSCPSHSQLMRWGNCISGLTTRASVTQDLVTLFESTADAYPDATAVEQGDVSLSYEALYTMSGQVAQELLQITSPGDVVCVHADRSTKWIGAIFGVLRAGCTYCPLDPALPMKLRESMVSAVHAKVFIAGTNDQLQTDVPRTSKVAVSVETMSLVEIEPLERRASPRPWTAAYICFTSGSTGTPKPVVCSHAGLVAFQSDFEVRLNAKPGVRISQIMSVAFDGSMHEIFSAITHGATLVLAAGADSLEPLSKADSAILTPSLARALDPTEFPNLRWVYLVGEPVPQSVSDRWSVSTTLYNMYGPSESTCGATIKRLLPGHPVTIGKPNPTTRVYILNSRRQLAQPGMIGRIVLAGVQVSQGYFGMAKETAERFWDDSIAGNGEKMYDSGDLGYWNEDGEVVCIGRTDRQIKLRGYRLDLDDLEIRIARNIGEVRAVAVTLPRGTKDELVAVMQPATLDLVDLRERLQATLPPYAVPRHIVLVEHIPTTGAGKTDYNAIASIHTSKGILPTETLVTETEKTIAAAFLEVLGKPAASLSITRHTRFTEVGGHSIEQIKLARHLTRQFAIAVSLTMVISNPTIKDLAQKIDQNKFDSKIIQSVDVTPRHSKDVAPIEQDWLSKYRIGSGIACFNVSFLGRMRPDDVDTWRLEHAFNTVLGRHEILRSLYRHVGSPLASKYHRITTEYSPKVERLTKFDVWSELNRPFHLDREHPIRVLLTAGEILVVISHVAADYTTLSTILREASSVYHGLEAPPTITIYPDSSLWGSNLSEDHTGFWCQLVDLPPQLPRLLRNSPQRNNYQGRSMVFRFDTDSSRSILRCPSSANTSLQQLALASVALALHTSDSDTLETILDVVLGVPYMNRERTEHAEAVGLFLQPLPVRIKHNWPSKSVSDFLSTVQQATQSALSHGILWHQLLEVVSFTPEYPDHPIFDVMVAFHEPRLAQQLRIDIPSLEPCLVWSEGAKFKLMCEFTVAADRTVILRMEYDHTCLSHGDISNLLQRIVSCMATLVTEQTLQTSDITAFGTTTPSYGHVLDPDRVLGKPLVELA
ncbi:uncharacterized protein E0L32_011261 [Thyridium curvatum]|uniref:Carrier domain-containing protein n=1 Tax=Thyridium curvatum TaxID=1093900 RepID=A0A507BGD0_9PEZI|nr:uncharacterized protein E0L32_011261 [Thyridium curvatum]TPX19017.1 hypothetical protein E0L32_011261 [Thyridium curvatum]